MNTNEAEHYKIALTIAMDDEVDYKKVALEVAKSDPKLFIRASVLAGFAPEDGSDGRTALEQQCIALRDGGDKVAAIKAWRAKTGDSLKDAKWKVENLV